MFSQLARSARKSLIHKNLMSWKEIAWGKIGLFLLPLSLIVPAVATPVISPIADVNAYEDVYCDGIGYTVTDPEFDSILLGVTAHSSNPDLIPDANIVVIRAGYSGLITLRPITNAFGMATITATVTNPDGASSSTIFTYNVEPLNDPPTLDALADRVLTVNAATQVVPLTGITCGPANEMQDLAVSAYAHPPGILTNVQVNYTGPNTTGTLYFDTVSNATGTAIIDVFVDDGSLMSHVLRRSFTVQVNPTNLPPSISAISDQVTDLNTAKDVNFTVGDQETPADSLVLSVTSSNTTLVPAANVVLGGSSSNRTATITPAADQSGITLVSIAVTDGAGSQSQASFLFTVRPDALVPVISMQPQSQTVGTGTAASLNVAAVGGEPLSYQWQYNGSNLSLQTNATLVITNVQPGDAGDYTAVVTNAQGSVTSFAAQLRVLPSPSFSQIVRSNGTAVLSFNTVPRLTYSIEYKNDLNETSWKLLDVGTGTGASMVVSDPGAKEASRFYRLRVE